MSLGRRIGKLWVEVTAPKDRVKQDLSDIESEVEATSSRIQGKFDRLEARSFSGSRAFGERMRAGFQKTKLSVDAVSGSVGRLTGLIAIAATGAAALSKWWNLVDKWTQRAVRAGEKYRNSVDAINGVIQRAQVETQRLRGEDVSLLDTLAEINAEHERAVQLIEQEEYVSKRQREVAVLAAERERDKQIEAAKGVKAREEAAAAAEREARATEEALNSARSLLETTKERNKDETAAAQGPAATERLRFARQLADLTDARIAAEEAGLTSLAASLKDQADIALQIHKDKIAQIDAEAKAKLDAELETIRRLEQADAERARRAAEAFEREMSRVTDKIAADISGALNGNDIVGSFHSLQRSIDMLRRKL